MTAWTNDALEKIAQRTSYSSHPAGKTAPCESGHDLVRVAGAVHDLIRETFSVPSW